MKSKQVEVGLYVGIGLVLLVVFVTDTHMALGFTPWLLYVVPLGLTYWTSTHYAPLVVAGLCTVLIGAGAAYDLSPPLAPEYVALTNRAIGVATLWVLAWLIMRYQVLAQRQSTVAEQLKLELMQRTQDLGRAVGALRTVAEQRNQGAEEGPMVAHAFKRQVTHVLDAERRRLEEKVTHLVREEPSPQDAAKSLDATLEELERLGKQLELWQRDLLKP